MRELFFLIVPFSLFTETGAICGVANNEPLVRPRIVGGKNVKGFHYSWYGILVDPDDYAPFCGANLISHKHLLSAAHCYDDILQSDNNKTLESAFDVHLGVINVCTPNKRRQIFHVNSVIIHPKYGDVFESKLSSDIVIITINGLADTFMPICLPYKAIKMSKGHVIGFGSTRFNFNGHVCALREIFVDIFSRKKCSKSSNPSDFNKLDTICAGIDAGGVDACQGDSGGLLQVKDNLRQYFLVGIVSYGEECALQNHPGIYTNVTFHLKWILNMTNDLQ